MNWELVGSAPVAAQHRRLSIEHLVGFVHGGLHHKREMPSTEDLQRWQRLKRSSKPDESPDPHQCTGEVIAPLISCLFKEYSVRLSCMQALKERSKDCANVPLQLADLLLSHDNCGGERAALCGGAVNAHLLLARPSSRQTVLASFILATNISHLPHEAFVAIASTVSPGATLLRSLATKLQLSGNGTDQSEEREHLLMAAGAAVFHARHGFANTSARSEPIVLKGARKVAAAAISAAIADTLQGAMDEDGKWEAAHSRARSKAAFVWEKKMSVHEREAIAAHFAQTSSVEGLQWEIDSGNLATHEVRSLWSGVLWSGELWSALPCVCCAAVEYASMRVLCGVDPPLPPPGTSLHSRPNSQECIG